MSRGVVVPVAVLGVVIATLVPGSAAFAADDAGGLPEGAVSRVAASVVADDPSVNERPAEVVDAVPLKRSADRRVVAVVNSEDGPRVEVLATGNRTEAVAAVNRLQDEDRVASIAIDTRVHLDVDYTSAQWGLSSLGAPGVWDGSQGAGVVVAVVDTGVQGSHPDLGGRVLSGARFVDASGGSTGDGRLDDNGHGTHVAGIVAADRDGDLATGIAPQSQVLPVKVLDSTGSGWTSDVAVGIIWAADHGADVINMSLGGPDSGVMRSAADYAVSREVAVFAAAGNDGRDEVSYPAGYPGVVGVGAVDRTHQVAYFSNRGSHVDLAAPGVQIWSSYPTSTVAQLSGTSMATPYAAGGAALVLAAQRSGNPGAHGADVIASLRSTAVDLGSPGWDSGYGYGLVNPAGAMGLAGTPAPDSPAAVAPGSPRGVRVMARGRSLKVTFHPPESAGSAAVTGYQVRCVGRGRTLSASIGADARGVIFRPVSAPARYRCAVRAGNGQWGGWTPQTRARRANRAR